MKTDWILIFLGVVSAVIAAFVIEWLNRVFSSPTDTVNQTAWKKYLSSAPLGFDYYLSCGLPNYNLRPDNPAFTYQAGAPVTNYRSYTRVGVLEVPAQ